MDVPTLSEDDADGLPADGSATAVLLRALTSTDVPDLAGLLGDPAHRRWCHGEHAASDRSTDPTADDRDLEGATTATTEDLEAAAALVADAARCWARGSWLGFAIEHGGRCAGLAALRPDEAGAADLEFCLAPWARRQHLASAAVHLLLTWGFAHLGLGVVHWRAEVGDWSARRVAWSCGLAVEGTVRDLLTSADGARRDAWLASLRWGEPLRPRAPWLAPVPLTGDGLRLGPFVAGDVDRVAQACAAPSTQSWLPALPRPYTVLDAAAWVSTREEVQAAGTEVTWAVRADDDAQGPAGPLLASVGLFHLSPDGDCGEVGYWAHPDARSRGVVTAAVRLVARYALTPSERGGLGLHRLGLRAAAGNAASRRVARKAGFTDVGVERDGERMRDGTRMDFVRYDLLASELP